MLSIAEVAAVQLSNPIPDHMQPADVGIQPAKRLQQAHLDLRELLPEIALMPIMFGVSVP